MNDLEIIKNKIYEIRGQRVMLDRDLAAMYGVTTGSLNQSVKRNIDRFPEDFMFRLSDEETKNWKSQIVISNSIKMGVRHNPYAFTELGVAMLSSVLHSETAIQINMAIMRAFVAIRKMISLPNTNNRIELIESELNEIKEEMNAILADQNDINEDTHAQLDAINTALAELQAKEPEKKERKPIGFVHYDD